MGLHISKHYICKCKPKIAKSLHHLRVCEHNCLRSPITVTNGDKAPMNLIGAPVQLAKTELDRRQTVVFSTGLRR